MASGSSGSGAGGNKPMMKPIFSSPGQLDSVDTGSMEAMINKHLFPEELDKFMKNMKKDEHEKRIKAQLRKPIELEPAAIGKIQITQPMHMQ